MKGCRLHCIEITVTHFVTCDIYLCEQLMRLALKFVMQYDRDFMELINLYLSTILNINWTKV
jgi:hypothetical protein